jgi:hypothetical protein
VFAEEIADDFRDRLLDAQGVLVWVDPVTSGRDFVFGSWGDGTGDRYALIEINVSAVLPFPPNAPVQLARKVRAALI